jgi:hypothetical protein
MYGVRLISSRASHPLQIAHLTRSRIFASIESHFSGLDSFPTPQVLHTYSYNHARRLRLEKLLYIGLYRRPNGFF